MIFKDKGLLNNIFKTNLTRICLYTLKELYKHSTIKSIKQSMFICIELYKISTDIIYVKSY